MADARAPRPNPGQPHTYQIRTTGHLGQQWMDWFDGLVITLEENGDTLLSGPVTDQAALYGLLRRMRDIGLPLVSVTRIQPPVGGTRDATDA